MNKALEAKLKTLPRNPGVYFHKAITGEIIYVGKAAVLKNRVRQYFQSSRDMDAKTRALVAEIHDTDWTETESEIDALFLESEMVKRFFDVNRCVAFGFEGANIMNARTWLTSVLHPLKTLANAIKRDLLVLVL